MPDWGTVLRDGCARFKGGIFDPFSEEEGAAVLGGEGLKRLESFVFELLFQRSLEHMFPQVPVAYGWYVVATSEDAAPLWIKLETAPLGAADEQLLTFLDTTECLILKVRYSEETHGFWGAWREKGQWENEQQLSALLADSFGEAKPVTGPPSAPPDRARVALEQLFSRQSPEERKALFLSRMLINCYIVPYVKVQPMDLDAVALSESGTLQFLEFKRKYPTASYEFGLDEVPHIALARWLFQYGKSLSNVVLCDPLWDKSISPLHLVLDRRTRPYAYWLGIHLTPEIIDTVSRLKTKGKDSGMYSGERTQFGISVDRYVVLGRSFAPKNLQTFIDGHALTPIKKDELLTARDMARSLWKPV